MVASAGVARPAWINAHGPRPIVSGTGPAS
jgi:hypothetical protein